MSEKIDVPQEILDAVKPQRIKWMRKEVYAPPDAGLLKAAKFFGIVPQDATQLNKFFVRNLTIDALDKHAPNWRGYPAPEANPATICK